MTARQLVQKRDDTAAKVCDASEGVSLATHVDAIRPWPAGAPARVGLKTHFLAVFVAVSSAMNAVDVVRPPPTHVLAPSAPLNVVGIAIVGHPKEDCEIGRGSALPEG